MMMMMSDEKQPVILTIDDEKAIRESIRNFLEDYGYQVLEAENGRVGLEIFAREEPDLLLVDLRMPEVDGLDVLARVRERSPDTPAIVISGTGIIADAVEALRLGAWDYLLKPIEDLSVLRHTVESALERARLIRENRVYQEHLEALVQERTAELTRANEQLTKEIDERIEAGKALRASEEKYRLFVENAGEGIALLNTRGKILEINPRAAEIIGLDRQELIGKNVARIVPLIKFDRERAIALLKKTTRGELTPKSEMAITNRAGKKRIISGSITPVKKETKVIGISLIIEDITEYKRAEEALLESEERYRTLFDAVPVGLYRTTPEGQFLDANLAMARMLGYPDRASLLVINAVELYVNPKDRRRWQALLEREEVTRNFEAQWFCHDRTIIWARESARIIRDDEGRTLYYDGVMEDITKRVRAEAEIHRRNRELALLNRVIAASAANLKPEAVLEMACRELAQAFEAPHAAATLLNKERTATVVAAEYRATDRTSILSVPIPVQDDPLTQHLLAHKTPLAVDDVRNDPRLNLIRDLLRRRGTVSMLLVPLTIEGEVMGSLSLGTTELHPFSDEEVGLVQSVADQIAGALAQARLVQTQQRLSTAIEQSAESVIITDTEGIITYVNPAFEQTTGYSQAETIGQNPHILKSGQQNTPFYQELWDTIAAGQAWHGRFVNKKKDGDLYTEDATITPVRNESGEIINYVSVQRDVTRELELEEQYRQAQKMEAVGQLAGGIAHDFNNILTAIIGYASLPLDLDLLPPNHPVRSDLQGIQTSAQRAADLTRQLLAFARRQVTEPRALNLNNLILNMDRMLRRLISEDIELVTLPAPSLGPVKIDPGQFEQVLVNLVVNACDAMPDGGKLTIKTGNTCLDEGDAARYAEIRPGEYIMLAVSDTGVGMAAEVKEHIFEPFFTTKAVGEGSGLGLATCFGIVKQNDGHIWVHSEPGQGSTFKVYLPRVAGVVNELTGDETEDEWQRGTETILLAEDEPAVRALAARVLRGQGYTVLEAANGKEALRLDREHSQKIHLLLTDVIMPQMGGPALADQMKARHPGIKVLFISGYTDDIITHHGVPDSGIVFMQKPFTPESLVRKVREVLDILRAVTK